MSDRAHSPRPMGFVSAISDTNVEDTKEKDHNPLHQVAHYLKNSVTLESKADEQRRESIISTHAHVNDHGGKQAEAEFWEKHSKHNGPHEHGHASHGHGHVEATNEPVGHVTAQSEHAKSGGPVTGTLF